MYYKRKEKGQKKQQWSQNTKQKTKIEELESHVEPEMNIGAPIVLPLLNKCKMNGFSQCLIFKVAFKLFGG
jgi:hypothetical protein